ncbi:hypothetical protein [Rhodoferax antarcticus]|uniref:hypothetical protein n=1 Tax=Rhodoferax antarcticus TaxID=81479 RepID=UPI001F518C7F|nr:hypothetical protein [Rhodoferax antarcticus]
MNQACGITLAASASPADMQRIDSAMVPGVSDVCICAATDSCAHIDNEVRSDCKRVSLGIATPCTSHVADQPMQTGLVWLWCVAVVVWRVNDFIVQRLIVECANVSHLRLILCGHALDLCHSFGIKHIDLSIGRVKN